MPLRLIILSLLVAACAARSVPAPVPPTVVYVVRHAEKAAGEDPPLSEAGRRRAAALREMLRSVDLVTIYATDTRRTQETVAPVAEAMGLTPFVLPRLEIEGLAHRLEHQHPGQAVLVAAHSDTIPMLLRRLGVAEPAVIEAGDYDDVWVLALCGGVPGIQHLHYPDLRE